MKNLDFLRQNLIAHRGVFNNKDIPENSIPAFSKAIEKNYIIELDVHLTQDNKVIVMHDDDINRMTNGQGMIKNQTLEQLKMVKLKNTQEKIPLLTEVLDLVDGRVPLIIELKYDRKAGELEEKLAEILDNYKGKFAVKSFNPLSIKWFKKNKPEYIRGLLIDENYRNVFEKIAAKTLYIAICRPDFISCSYNLYNDKRIIRLKKKKFIMAWTIRDKKNLEIYKNRFDNLICENI